MHNAVVQHTCEESLGSASRDVSPLGYGSDENKPGDFRIFCCA